MSIKEIKTAGREAFKANYWRCVIAAFLLLLLIGGVASSSAGNAQNTMGEEEVSGILDTLSEEQLAALVAVLAGTVLTASVVGLALKIFLFNPIKVGCYLFFVRNAKDHSATLGAIREGFGGYGRTLLTLFLSDLFVCLWSLLFLIPGLVKAYSYRLVPYLIKDQPELSAMEVLRRSEELMRGNRWKAFKLDLSFIGWYILGALTLGALDLFWVTPYHESAGAVFYQDLKR
ncbi:MAG: DUF975 family protein [bacterium]